MYHYKTKIKSSKGKQKKENKVIKHTELFDWQSTRCNIYRASLGVLLLGPNNCLYQCCMKKTALMFQYQNNISFFFTCKDQTSDQSHFVSMLRGVHHGDTSVQFEKFMFNH